MTDWNDIKYKGWRCHQHDITIAEKRRLTEKITDVDRVYLAKEYEGLVERFDEIKSRFELTNFMTKTDENWLDVLGKRQKVKRRLANFRNVNS